MAYTLRLYADRLAPGAALELAAGAVRALYVEDGQLAAASFGTLSSLAPNSAWFGGSLASLCAGAQGARLLRFELVAGEGGGDGALLASPPLALDRHGEYLLRCDRVEFPPGGIAYRHTHQGAGLRCLVDGTIRIEAGGQSHGYAAGEAWFESGVDPVLATASPTATTAFIRVMVLPRALVGKSSIRYVDDSDKDKPRVQRYQIYLDQPIALPGSAP
jgi:quercetin dioxygenase-like cupin family protein